MRRKSCLTMTVFEPGLCTHVTHVHRNHQNRAFMQKLNLKLMWQLILSRDGKDLIETERKEQKYNGKSKQEETGIM